MLLPLLPSVDPLRPFRLRACIDRVIGHPAYDQCHPNRTGGDPYDTFDHVNFRGKTPSLFAPPAVTHTAVYGPFVPVLLDGAHQQSHGQSRLQPAPSKLSEGVIPTKLSAIPISVSGGKHPHYLRHLTWPIPPPVGRLRPFQSTARVDGVVCKGTIDWF